MTLAAAASVLGAETDPGNTGALRPLKIADPLPTVRQSLSTMIASWEGEHAPEDLESLLEKQPYLVGRVARELIAAENVASTRGGAPVGGGGTIDPAPVTPSIRDLLEQARGELGSGPTARLVDRALERGLANGDRQGSDSPQDLALGLLLDRGIAVLVSGGGQKSGADLARLIDLADRRDDLEAAAILREGRAVQSPSSESWRDSAAAFDRAGDDWSAARAWLMAALAAKVPGEAEEAYLAAALGARASGDAELLAETQYEWGRWLLGEGRAAEALTDFGEAEPWFLAEHREDALVPVQTGIAEAARSLADERLDSGETTDVGSIIDRGIEAARAALASRSLAWLEYEKARLATFEHRGGDALRLADSAAARFEALADEEGVMYAQAHAGGELAAAGRFAEAAARFGRAEAAAVTIDADEDAVGLLVDQSTSLRRAERFPEARRKLDEAVERARVETSSATRALIDKALGDLLVETGQVAEACASYASAWRVTSSGDLGLRFAAALLAAGRSEDARRVLERVDAHAIPELEGFESRLRRETAARAESAADGKAAVETPDGAAAIPTPRPPASPGADPPGHAELRRRTAPIAPSGIPGELLDEAASAARGGETDRARRLARLAIARGLDPVFLDLDPVLAATGTR